jgi:hypothetical protein
MRKSFWIMLAVLIAAIGVPTAHADSITNGTFNFTVTSGSPPPTGSFVWDSTKSTWNLFNIDWDGLVFNFAPLFPNLGALPTTGTWLGNANVTASENDFSIGQIDAINTTPLVPFALAEGTYSVTETVVGAPEPSSVALMLLGVGLVFVMRKRIGQGLPQAS